jgi:integrase
MRTNPVHGIKPVKVPPSQTLPFDEDQVAKILYAFDRYPIKGVYASENRTRMKALTLLLRYSGLRIRDAVTCERVRMVDGKLFLYQAKTGTPVYCPLPPTVVEALQALKASVQSAEWAGSSPSSTCRRGVHSTTGIASLFRPSNS